MSSKSGFWKSVVSVGKKALSHVNLSFDGADCSFHIDIAPIVNRAVIGSSQDAVSGRLPARIAVSENASAAQPISVDPEQ